MPAIDATFRVADFMRFKRFPENGSSRAVGLADIVSDAFLFVDIDEKKESGFVPGQAYVGHTRHFP